MVIGSRRHLHGDTADLTASGSAQKAHAWGFAVRSLRVCREFCPAVFWSSFARARFRQNPFCACPLFKTISCSLSCRNDKGQHIGLCSVQAKSSKYLAAPSVASDVPASACVRHPGDRHYRMGLVHFPTRKGASRFQDTGSVKCSVHYQNATGHGFSRLFTRYRLLSAWIV